MFEKNLNIGYLLDFYGELLTDRKREVLDYYYNDDLSLSEIAEEIGISRQGVRDIIKKAEEELLFFEEKLHLAGRFSDAEKQIRRIEELVRGKAPDAFGEVKAELDALAEKLKSF
ncbi:MAG: YlxM family DNA-binding protein [Eubacteriales bacterium]